MSWAIGYDTKWKRDIGYGVPAYCDYPGCGREIDRGLSYVCGSQAYGGEHGCGLYFCDDHRTHYRQDAIICERCAKGKSPYAPSQEHPDWLNHKLTDESWKQWRKENPGQAAAIYIEIMARAAKK